MFSLFERYLQPTAVPEHPEPPASLLAFLWHFARQAKGLFVALFVVEFFVALTDSAVPWFMGRIVTLVTSIAPERFLTETWPWLAGMALVVRQSWAFFQNDFAGRISNRVMQTGPAVRQTLVASVTALWYVLVYGITAIVMSASADPWLTLPIIGWFAGYVGLLWYFVPRLRDRSKISSEARSALVARIVDSYTNILTVKLFARPRDEDNYVR